MLKKKSLFNEDYKNSKILNNDENQNVINCEDIWNNYPERGRQLKIRALDLSNNKTSTIYKISDITTNHSKNNRSGKETIKYQKKIFQKFKKFNRNSYLEDERNQSSDSSDSLKIYKRKEVLEDKRVKSKNSNSTNSEDNNNSQEELSEYLISNFEESLKNEIHNILIGIYNHHISSSSKLRKLDLSKFEKQINYFSKKLNNQFDVSILKILAEKIKELIANYKEQIFEIEDIKHIRERYYHYNKCFLKRKESIINETTSIINEGTIIEAKLNNNNFKRISKKNKANQENINLNESDNNVIKILLLELRRIKNSLIDSSKDVEKIFQLPLLNLQIKNKTTIFNFEEIHMEEFTETLVKDEFISDLMIQIKTNSKGLKIDEINLLILYVEEDVYSHKNEMTRFINYLLQIDSLSQSECVNESEKHNNSSKKQLSQIVEGRNKLQNDITNLEKQSSFPKNEKLKISQSIGLEELVKYIENSDKKKKKNRKRNKKKNESDLLNLQITLNCQNEEPDEAVEMFKKSLFDSTKNSCNEKKIKPLISKEWLSNLVSNTIKV